jgi:hypothetical protein
MEPEESSSNHKVISPAHLDDVRGRSMEAPALQRGRIMAPRNLPLRVASTTLALGTLWVTSDSVFASDENTTAAPPGGQKCEVAVVNPVSGYAECVKPRGAPVDQPPSRPAPTPEGCQRHVDLDLEECRQKQPKSRE